MLWKQTSLFGYSPVKNVLSVSILILCVIPSIVSAQDCLVPVEVYHEASQHVLSCNYPEAEKTMDNFMRKHPMEPAGPLFKAAVLQYENTDYEDSSREAEFVALIERAKLLARRKIEANGDDIWAQYYFYAAEGLRGVWTVASGNFVSGVLRSRSGAKGMERIYISVLADSTFYDSYMLIGSYRFWRNVALSRISWLPFIDAEKNGGIDEVKIALACGIFTGPLTATVLLEMLLEHDPEEAVAYGERMVAEYPSCRLFAWQLGEAYKKLERYDDAVRVFTGIADSMARDDADDGSGELRCWWKLAVLSKSVGKMDECVYYCNKVIELGKRESVSGRQRDRIEKARRMLDER